MAAAAARVPPELWIKVIREATHLPEALDTTLPDALPPEGTPVGLYSQEVAVMMRDSLRTKRAISLVCRSWHSICLEFFYEFVVVRDAHSLPRLVSLLSRLGAAGWVQRLDYAYRIPVPGDKGYQVVHHLVAAAAGLIRLCRNLRIFSCRTTGEGKNSLDVLHDKNRPTLHANARYLPNALMRAAGTLESIQWQTFPFLSPESPFLLDLHQRCLRLRSVFLPTGMRTYGPIQPNDSLRLESLFGPTIDSGDESDGDGIYGAYPLEQDSSLAFQSLHTIPLHSDSFWPCVHEIADGLPSLRHVVVDGHQDHDIFHSFISHNPQVETLTFDLGMLHFMDHVVFTNIRTVIFPFKDMPFVSYIYFPSVERVGLMGTEHEPKYDYSVFFDLLDEDESGGKMFPKLRLIRFVDAILARKIEKRNEQFKLLDQKCRSKGIRLENERGQLMVSRL